MIQKQHDSSDITYLANSPKAQNQNVIHNVEIWIYITLRGLQTPMIPKIFA
jgi:hypothetical protein